MAKEDMIELEGTVTDVQRNSRYRVTLENGHEIALADVLWRNFGRVVSHDQLWSAVYGALPDADLPGDPDNVIKVKLCHLRKKLKRVRVLIRPVYKLGYRMENAA